MTYFYARLPRNFWPLVSGRKLAMLHCFIFLYLAAASGGPPSLDHFARKKD